MACCVVKKDKHKTNFPDYGSLYSGNPAAAGSGGGYLLLRIPKKFQV
jgi:hypothetical protein